MNTSPEINIEDLEREIRECLESCRLAQREMKEETEFHRHRIIEHSKRRNGQKRPEIGS